MESDQALNHRQRQHQAVMESKPYQDEITFFRRLNTDYVLGLMASQMTSSRSPEFRDNSLLFRFQEVSAESAVAVLALVENGMHNPVRRELRHVLEHCVKAVLVDQQLPNASLDQRLEYLRENVPRSSVSIIDEVSLVVAPQGSGPALQSEVKGLFSRLSAYVHPSASQLAERLELAASGRSMGFETADELRTINSLTFQVYDLCLALTFQGLGFGLTGDLFVSVFDEFDRWKFHKGRFVSRISRNFDYKAERQRQAPRNADQGQ